MMTFDLGYLSGNPTKQRAHEFTRNEVCDRNSFRIPKIDVEDTDLKKIAKFE